MVLVMPETPDTPLTYNRFFVIGLPRSRSAWFANALTTPTSYCFHEGLVEGYRRFLDPDFTVDAKDVVGSAGSDGLWYARELLEDFPTARYISVRRPVEEVQVSLLARRHPTDNLQMGLDLQGLIETAPNCKVIDYHSIDLALCEELCNFVGALFEPERFKALLSYKVTSLRY